MVQLVPPSYLPYSQADARSTGKPPCAILADTGQRQEIPDVASPCVRGAAPDRHCFSCPRQIDIRRAGDRPIPALTATTSRREDRKNHAAAPAFPSVRAGTPEHVYDQVEACLLESARKMGWRWRSDHHRSTASVALKRVLCAAIIAWLSQHMRHDDEADEG